jgi:hypothetical protein
MKDKTIAILALILSLVAVFLSLNSVPAVSYTVQNDGVETRLSSLENELFLIKIKQQQHSQGTFTTTDSSFQLIETSYGRLLVSLQNSEKQGDGYRLSFHFGNPTTMTITDIKGKIVWKPLIDYKKYYTDAVYREDMNKKTREKEFSLTKDLLPGSWNKTSITIGPATEETIGEIELKELSSGAVKLYAR